MVNNAVRIQSEINLFLKNLKGSDYSLIKILYWHLPQGIEENHEKFQPGGAVLPPRALLLGQTVPYVTSTIIKLVYCSIETRAEVHIIGEFSESLNI
jgi:hypothetical protein